MTEELTLEQQIAQLEAEAAAAKAAAEEKAAALQALKDEARSGVIAKVKEMLKQHSIDPAELFKLNELDVLRESIKRAGYTVNDIFPESETEPVKKTRAKRGTAQPRKKSDLPPKYRHPEHPELTWHGGKGAKPKWVIEWLAAGKNINDTLIALDGADHTEEGE